MSAPDPVVLTGSRSPSPGRQVARFTAIGLLTVVAVAVGIALVARRNATMVAIDQASEITSITGRGVVEPLLTDRAMSGDPVATRALDAAVRRYVLSGSLVRVKVWAADGTIVYSDAAPLVGRRFPLEPDEQEALLTGGRDADVSDLDLPENAEERGFGRLLEVHVGIRTVSGAPVLYEAYFRYDAVVDAGWAAWRTFAPLAVGALLVLELVQIPLAFVLARRLEARERQRERLLRHAVESSTAERRRIAQDLHDGVVQELTGITYTLDAARLRSEDDAPDLLADTAARLRGSVGALRTLLVDIYPPSLSEEGLGAALAELAGSLRRRGLTVTDDVDGADRARAAEAALLYRAGQEAVRNIISHSGAEHVDIALRQGPAGWRLVVDDDGRGFDPDTHPAGEGHLGLRSLGDLLADAGGRLTVRAAPGAGTRVDVEVPVG